MAQFLDDGVEIGLSLSDDEFALLKISQSAIIVYILRWICTNFFFASYLHHFLHFFLYHVFHDTLKGTNHNLKHLHVAQKYRYFDVSVQYHRFGI